jgi:DUF4097 and DUF4098 domain-containing protein YvlB
VPEGVSDAEVETLRLNVSTRSGNVRVVAEPGVELSIDGGAVVGENEGELQVRRTQGAGTVIVHCPVYTDVTIGTVSGDIETEGSLGAVRVVTVSGKVRLGEMERADVRGKSGNVEIGTCNGDCRVVVISAKVRIGRAQRVSVAGVSGTVQAEDVDGAEVKTVSGKVQLGTTGSGAVSVHTVSGSVEVHVPKDIAPATKLRSISGRVRCECPEGGAGPIAIASVSGAIRVSCQ